MKRTQTAVSAPKGATNLRAQQHQGIIVPSQGYDSYYDEEPEMGEDEQDPVLQPPLWLFILGGLEVAWGSTSNLIQAGTSIVGILGWQQQDTLSAYGLAEGAKEIISKNLGFATVALVLGVSAQLGIQVVTQQISRTWKQKRIVEHESTQQALVEIASNVSMGQLLGVLSFLICAVSDYMFITSVDSTGSLGSYILMTLWALILACSSTYILHDGIQRVWSGVLSHRAWRLWQDALKAHYEGLAEQYPA